MVVSYKEEMTRYFYSVPNYKLCMSVYTSTYLPLYNKAKTKNPIESYELRVTKGPISISIVSVGRRSASMGQQCYQMAMMAGLMKL